MFSLNINGIFVLTMFKKSCFLEWGARSSTNSFYVNLAPLEKNTFKLKFKILFKVNIQHTYNTSSNEFLKSTIVYNKTTHTIMHTNILSNSRQQVMQINIHRSRYQRNKNKLIIRVSCIQAKNKNIKKLHDHCIDYLMNDWKKNSLIVSQHRSIYDKIIIFRSNKLVFV